MSGLLLEGVSALLADSSFTIPSAPASQARCVADVISKWIQLHPDEASAFEKNITTSLTTCIDIRCASEKLRRERMWATYHQLRISDAYSTKWNAFLQLCGSERSPILVQYVSHFIFKKLIVIHNPVEKTESQDTSDGLTYEEKNAIRYAAGWVARALKKKLLKATHPKRGTIQLCLWDMLDEGDDDADESKEWLELCDRGGLTGVNNMAFELFLEMEKQLRRMIRAHPCITDEVNQAIIRNNDIQFLWSIISADWDGDCATTLLEMIVSQWLKIRGFSYASAWVEKFKSAQKKTIQKTKGVRKHLMPKCRQEHEADSS